MGNLIVEKQHLKLQKTTSEVIIAFPQADTPSNAIQSKILDLFKTPWERTGFDFTGIKMTPRDKINAGVQEWQTQSRELLAGQQSSLHQQNIFQEQYFYIDFKGVVPGSAYQRTWHADHQPLPSTYITIDADRGLLNSDILHEVGHALGLAHEHQRIDRDDYVFYTNTLQQYNSSIAKGIQIGTNTMWQSAPFGPYDPDSIMHYPAEFALINTHTLVEGTRQALIFPDELSPGDLHTARFLYNESRIYEHLRDRNSSRALLFNNGMMDEEAKREKEIQHDRQKILLSQYVNGETVIERTHEAIKAQAKQLTDLGLGLERQDQALKNWSSENLEEQEANHEPTQNHSTCLML